MIYLVVLILLILLTLKYDNGGSKTAKNFWYNITLIILICIAGLRYRVGGDSLNYIDEYDQIPTLSTLLKYNFSSSSWDPLWVTFGAICKSIDKDFVILQCLHAIVVNTIIFRFIRKNTRYQFTGILLYYLIAYLNFNMEILRESLAISMFLLGLKYLREKKLIKYYFWVSIAFLFHSSAIVLFLLPFIPRFKLNKWTIGTLFLALVAMIVFRDRINALFSLFYFNQRIEAKAEIYTSYNLNIFGTIFNIIRFCVVPVYLLYFSERFLNFKYRYTFLILTMVGIGIVVIFVPIFARFNNYMIMIYVLFLTEFLNRIYRERSFGYLKTFIGGFAFLAISIMQLYPYFEDTSRYAIGTHHYNYWYPYHSIFDKELEQKRERLRQGEFYNGDNQ